MKTVSMLEFRKKAEEIIRQVERGRSFVLTYRGRPAARLQPLDTPEIAEDDPFYHLSELAAKTGDTLSNQEIDDIVYGQ